MYVVVSIIIKILFFDPMLYYNISFAFSLNVSCISNAFLD
jgi:hypothetical protein